MNTTEPIDSRKNEKNAVAGIHKGWRFVGIPLFWLMGWFLSIYFALAWLIVIGVYIILVSAMGIMNIPDQLNQNHKQVWLRKLFEILGPFAWGGFLALLYWLTYVLVFHFNDLNVR